MEMVIRVGIIYLVILAGLRLLGKREFGELSPLELVSLMLIPEIVSESLGHEDPSLTNGLIGIATLFLLVFLTSLVMYRFKRAEEMIEGMPAVLVQHGAYVEAAMHREHVTANEIATEMRKAGLERLDQIRWAVLETDGKISIIPEEQQAPGGANEATEERHHS
jgi:uncharacterized membrane protein YcaP (DUF421 family)